jgi:putative flippase GtrA
MKMMRDLLNTQMFRFMFMGLVSTGTMFVLYLLFNLVIGYQISYLISYVLTVIFSYVLNSKFVFNTPMTWQTFLQFPLVYVFQYVTSALGLEVLVRLGFSVTYAPLMIILLLLPITFILSRYIMGNK